MRSILGGVRGRVTFSVLAITAVLYSLLGALGFAQIASSGRDSIRERTDQVLDDLEVARRSGVDTVQVSTADGVTAVAYDPADPPPPARDGIVEVRRTIAVGGTTELLVGTSTQAPLTDSLRSLFRALWIGIPMAAITSAALAGMATRRALSPVADITELAATIGAGGDGRRVPVPDTDDEIERLARTVNEMLDRIEAGRALQRQFTSDAAHELRTPLMALQGELELAQTADRRRAEPDSRADVADTPSDPLLHDRLSALTRRLGERIDDLVLLSTLDEARPLVLAPTPITALVHDEAASLSADIAVTGPDVVATVDRDLVARAARNLLVNAQRHARAVVACSVVLEPSGRGGPSVWIHVDDDGPGVDPDRHEVLFSRFARLDEARAADRGGSGLGLAIVASVADAHGGEVAVGTSALGGARMSIRLPLGSSDDPGDGRDQRPVAPAMS